MRVAPVAIDAASLRNIRMLQRPGRPDLLAAIIEIYLSTTPGEVDTLVAAVAARDLALAGRTAHKLKGNSRAVGALRVGDLLASIEAAVDEATPAPLASRVAELREAHDDALRELTTIVGVERTDEHDE